MRTTQSIVLASNNLDKLSEFRQLLSPLTIIPASEFVANSKKLALVEIYPTYAENAAAKARLINHAAHFPALGDDSGLEVQALEGKPGVRSARYATPKAGQSQDAANIQKLLESLKGIAPAQRSARFVCSLALVMEGILLEATGILEGTILEAPAGKDGFGYDPVFVPQGQSKSLAQMTALEKNAISHRAQAVKALLALIEKKGVNLAKV